MIKTHIPARPRNKKIVPTGSASISPNISSAVGSSHTHNNKPVIDQLTQGNIDVLSYLSLYQTGVEMEVLLDEFGQPVLDINGDPVTEQIPVYAIRSTATFFSEKEVSAYELGEEEGGGGGGGSDYERLDTWAIYDSSKADWVLSAFLGNDLNTRVTAIDGRVTNLENSGGGGGGSTVEWGTLTNGYRQLTVEGVTYSLAQNTHKHLWADITDKPSTFTPSAHSHGWSEITDKPSTFTPSAHTHSAGDITSGTFAIARIPTGTTGTTVALGNHLHTGVYEPVFSKNTAFNKNFGTTSGTVAQGNDSRIINGQTAYGWGNHASAGYALNSDFNTHNNDNIRHITGAERTKWDGVETDFNNLEIGGRNYFSIKEAKLVQNVGGYKTVTIQLLPNTQYIASTSVPEIAPTAFNIFADKNPISRSSAVNGLAINKPKLITTDSTGKIDVSASASFIDNIINGTYYFQIEKGNKATDWSPAPEDQVSDWATTNVNSFSFIKNKPTTLSGYGITDAVTLNTAQTITGAKTFSAALTASVSVTTPKVIFSAAGWSLEQSGTELQMKYNGTAKMRFLSGGSIVATQEITAYS